MSLFSSRRTKCRVATAMLLVWLFAVGSAWANACLIQDSRTHLHGSAHGESLPDRALLVSPGHLGADTVHAENAGAAKSVCLKVCGDGAQAIVKWAPDVGLADIAMAPPVTFSWTARLAAAAPGNVWPEPPAPRPGPPLRIRYSRLAL